MKNLDIIKLESSAIQALLKLGKLVVDGIELVMPSRDELNDRIITIDHSTLSDIGWASDKTVASYIVLAQTATKMFVIEYYYYVDNFYKELETNDFERRKIKAAQDWEIEQIRTYGPDWKEVQKKMDEVSYCCCDCCNCDDDDECIDD